MANIYSHLNSILTKEKQKMNITYSDFGNLVIDRSNQLACTTTINNFATTLVIGLQNAVYIDPNVTPTPRSYNGQMTNFYSPSGTDTTPETALTYVSGNGAFPTGVITIWFSSPTTSTNFYTDFKFSFNVEFFDVNRITVTAVGVPSVTAKFDVSNIDQPTFNLFLYSILGTAIPVWMDEVSNYVWNNVTAN
jgi:hypothetical protein